MSLTKLERLPLQASFLFYLIVCLVVLTLVWMYFLPVEETVRVRGYVSFTGPATALSAPTTSVVKSVEVESLTKIQKGDGLLVVEIDCYEQVVVKSPASGVLIWEKPLIPGDVIQFPQRLAVIYPEKPVGVIGYLSELDMGRVTPGLLGRVSLDAYPSRDFGTISGTVKRLSLEKTLLTGAEIGPVAIIELETPDHSGIEILPGLTATVDIITKRTRLLHKFF